MVPIYGDLGDADEFRGSDIVKPSGEYIRDESGFEQVELGIDLQKWADNSAENPNEYWTLGPCVESILDSSGNPQQKSIGIYIQTEFEDSDTGTVSILTSVKMTEVGVLDGVTPSVFAAYLIATVLFVLSITLGAWRYLTRAV